MKVDDDASVELDTSEVEDACKREMSAGIASSPIVESKLAMGELPVSGEIVVSTGAKSSVVTISRVALDMSREEDACCGGASAEIAPLPTVWCNLAVVKVPVSGWRLTTFSKAKR